MTKCDGDYEVDARRSQLRWTRPLVDADNASGTLEFTIRKDKDSKTDQFFPVILDFISSKSYCGVEVLSHCLISDNHSKSMSRDLQKTRATLRLVSNLFSYMRAQFLNLTYLIVQVSQGLVLSYLLTTSFISR